MIELQQLLQRCNCERSRLWLPSPPALATPPTPVAPTRVPALASRTLAAVAMADGGTLFDWLRNSARIHDNIMDNTLQKLEAEDVLAVADLRVLRDLGGLGDVFTRVTAAKISAALDATYAPTSIRIPTTAAGKKILSVRGIWEGGAPQTRALLELGD
jgi:hypothetical protein